MNKGSVNYLKKEFVFSDYMRDEWNVLYIELPDGEALVHFFDSKRAVSSQGRYITTARVSDLVGFIKNSHGHEFYRTKDGVKIARKRLESVLNWVGPRVAYTQQRKSADTINLLSLAIRNMRNNGPVCE